MKIKYYEMAKTIVKKAIRPITPNRARVRTRSLSRFACATLVAGAALACGNATTSLPQKPKADAGISMDGGTASGWGSKDSKYCVTVTLEGAFAEGTAHPIILRPQNFNYAHAKPDLADVRAFAGTCGDAHETLPLFIEFAEARASAVWVRTPLATQTSIALYYGNPNAASVSNPKTVFLAYGKGADFDMFDLRKDERANFQITGRGIEFVNFPWGNGVAGTQSYVAMRLPYPVEDFELNWAVMHESNDRRPYSMVAVADALVPTFIESYDGIGVFRGSADVGDTQFAVRASNRGLQAHKDSTLVPFPGAAYHLQIRRIGDIAYFAAYAAANERTLEENPIAVDKTAEGRPLHVVRLLNAPPTPVEIVYALMPPIIDDRTQLVTGIHDDVRFFPHANILRRVGPEKMRSQ